ncbi:GRAS family protein TF80-like [Gastrolobium bilobum]|uniref:GRAS family protein TF80-like n=1 Tax=Gastrolobium bilobum TaxID=150636 RepID=UPI002AB1FC91|nr:GRAS family protein TF80-like [Gastrolobium bilobum]
MHGQLVVQQSQFMDPGSQYQFPEETDRGLQLVHLLKDCVKYIESGNITRADTALYKISKLAPPHGDSMQRVATYFSEALAFQVIKNRRGIPKILGLSKTLSTSEELLVKKLFFELYPFSKSAYKITNQAIIEAMDGEKIINILDLSVSDATQWIYLMQSLKERLPNHSYLKITITGIHEKKEVLEQMELHLRVEAENMNFSFQFNAIVSNLENLDLERLPFDKGEPLAISCVLQLHSLLATDDQMVKNPSPDSTMSPLSTCPSPKMECFLSGLWKLRPKVMVITEQESNVNGSTLTERINNALNFYGALFDCLEATISKASVERTLVEKMLLREQIKNIIACEGVKRKERHEKLETWITRLLLAGFVKVPISFGGMLQTTKLLQSYIHGYQIRHENECLFICWNGNPLFYISAWRFPSDDI